MSARRRSAASPAHPIDSASAATRLSSLEAWVALSARLRYRVPMTRTPAGSPGLGSSPTRDQSATTIAFLVSARTGRHRGERRHGHRCGYQEERCSPGQPRVPGLAQVDRARGWIGDLRIEADDAPYRQTGDDRLIGRAEGGGHRHDGYVFGLHSVLLEEVDESMQVRRPDRGRLS